MRVIKIGGKKADAIHLAEELSQNMNMRLLFEEHAPNHFPTRGKAFFTEKQPIESSCNCVVFYYVEKPRNGDDVLMPQRKETEGEKGIDYVINNARQLSMVFNTSRVNIMLKRFNSNEVLGPYIWLLYRRRKANDKA